MDEDALKSTMRKKGLIFMWLWIAVTDSWFVMYLCDYE